MAPRPPITPTFVKKEVKKVVKDEDDDDDDDDDDAAASSYTSAPKISFNPVTQKRKLPFGAQFIKGSESDKLYGSVHVARPAAASSKAGRKAAYPHDAEGALVLHEPAEPMEEEDGEGTPPTTPREVHIVMAPWLSAKLRPHQREGVRFIYDACVRQPVSILRPLGFCHRLALPLSVCAKPGRRTDTSLRSSAKTTSAAGVFWPTTWASARPCRPSASHTQCSRRV